MTVGSGLSSYPKLISAQWEYPESHWPEIGLR